MRKDIGDYKLYVFDLDGTLYDQPKLRMIMAIRLMSYYALHPFSAGDLFILKHFRKVKDSWTKRSSDDDIIRKDAEDKRTDEEKVKNIVRRWIYDDPLKIIALAKDEALIAWMNELRQNGKRVVILSDYPAADKLAAMGVSVDATYGPEDERIDELKPSSKGLNVIMSDENTAPEDVLMIGDREEKDGAAALAAGVDKLILPRKVKKREHEKYKG